MRLSKTSTIVTGLVISVFMLSGCTKDDPAPPTPTATVSLAPTPAPSEPAVVPAQDLEVDDTALTSLTAPAGVDAVTFSALRTTARSFSLATVTNTAALSGEWTITDIAAGFAEHSSADLLAQISALDPANLDHSYTIMSLASVLKPTEDMTALKDCTPSAEWTECLTQNIVYSDASTALDAPLSAVKFSFVVSTVRGVLVAGEPKQSPVRYSMNIWVDVATQKVVAVDNDFSFAPVS